MMPWTLRWVVVLLIEVSRHGEYRILRRVQFPGQREIGALREGCVV